METVSCSSLAKTIEIMLLNIREIIDWGVCSTWEIRVYGDTDAIPAIFSHTLIIQLLATIAIFLAMDTSNHSGPSSSPPLLPQVLFSIDRLREMYSYFIHILDLESSGKKVWAGMIKNIQYYLTNLLFTILNIFLIINILIRVSLRCTT